MYILEKKLNVDNSLIVQDLDIYENLICPLVIFLELTLSSKQDAIAYSSHICLNDLHVHENIIIDVSFIVNNLINNEILVSFTNYGSFVK